MHVARHPPGSPRGLSRRCRGGRPAARRGSRLQRGARVLRSRHREEISRRAAGPALRTGRNGPAPPGGHDFHHRAHDQRRQAGGTGARRRLDHRHQGSQPVGPVGTYRARYRGRVRGSAAVRGHSASPEARGSMLSPAATPADTANPFARLKASIQAERAALQVRFRERADGPAVLREHCRLIDRTLKDVWRQIQLPAPLALLAVGGYGRGELYPHSDIDVLILLKDAASPELAAKIEELVGRLWDMGLELGHSVRTVAQCAEEAAKDVTVMTSLLEARLLTGSRELFARFEHARGESVDQIGRAHV